MAESSVDKKACAVIDQLNDMRSARRQYEGDWRDIKRYVRPDTSEFNEGAPGIAQSRNNDVYDGTAIDANNKLAAGLSSFCSNPAERWFHYEVIDMRDEDYDEEALLWLEHAADVTYNQYSRHESNWTSAMNEVYLDIGGFGNLNLYQSYDWDKGVLCFKSYSMADSYFDVNSEGLVTKVARVTSMTSRQIRQEFVKESDILPKEVMEDKLGTRKFKVVHMVLPRSDVIYVPGIPTTMPFASLYVIEDVKWTIRESGFMDCPYHAARWSTPPEEIYGRGPAWSCLPDIRMLNRMEYCQIRGVQKAVDPPLIVPDEMFLTKLRVSPGAVNYRDMQLDPQLKVDMLPIYEKGLMIGEEKLAQKREFIRSCFHADWLLMGKETIEMTAFEVADRREEKLRMLSPMLGRIMRELLAPMLKRSFSLLSRAGHIRPAPASLDNRKLKITYVSPAAKAQTGIKAMESSRFVQEILPLGQLRPEILDVINWDEYVAMLGEARNTSRRILNTRQRIAAIRSERAQMQQAQMLAGMAEPATKALKNVAEAQNVMTR